MQRIHRIYYNIYIFFYKWMFQLYTVFRPRNNSIGDNFFVLFYLIIIYLFIYLLLLGWNSKMRVQMHLRTAALGKCTVSSSSSSASLWRTRFLLVDHHQPLSSMRRLSQEATRSFRQQRPLHVPSLAVALSHLHINQSIFSGTHFTHGANENIG